MDVNDCRILAAKIGCKPIDIATFYWGDGSECEAYGAYSLPHDTEFDGSGDCAAAEAALNKFFGEDYVEFADSLECLPGLFDHAMHYIMTGETMKPSGGRHISVLSPTGKALLDKYRERFTE